MKPLTTLSLDELARVSGGLFPLLGLIGGIAGQVTGTPGGLDEGPG